MVLPAELYSDRIQQVIAENASVIICGQTGCGKSTIVPQAILDSGFLRDNSCIAVTQPRRVAASSLAIKVAADRGKELGNEVGYKFRFENITTDQTRLIYITDGMLLKEYANDNLLHKYSCIILDEVHERSLNNDILMWCLRRVQIERSEKKNKLRLVLMSATMDLEPLKEYFGAPAYFIPGRTYPVELFYTDKADIESDAHFENAVKAVVQLHEIEELESAFLVFLTGQEEIEAACRTIRNRLAKQPVRVIPFYAQNRQQDIAEIFREDPTTRKIVVATNIAETSITIPDVRIVIDSGKVKRKDYIHDRRLAVLSVQPISKAQAIQRAGRAGRCSDGKCYRLYSEKAYNLLETQTKPEILRTSLTEVLMSLFAAKMTTIKGLKLLDQPAPEDWCSALDELIALELISAHLDSKTYEPGEFLALKEHKVKMSLTFKLTKLGEAVRRLPVSPMLARFLYVAHKYKCLFEAQIVAAFCSTEDFCLPQHALSDQEKENHSHLMRTLQAANGDHCRFVLLYKIVKKMNKNELLKWCENNGVSDRRIQEALEIRKQLRKACADEGLKIDDSKSPYTDLKPLVMAIADSFFLNTCFGSAQKGVFRVFNDMSSEIHIHPSSSLVRTYPSTMVYTELVRTSQLYARSITVVDRDRVTGHLKRLGLYKSVKSEFNKRQSLDDGERRHSGPKSFAHLDNFPV